jgi:hypothetical protein
MLPPARSVRNALDDAAGTRGATNHFDIVETP